jgi:hypothetical protein
VAITPDPNPRNIAPRKHDVGLFDHHLPAIKS